MVYQSINSKPLKVAALITHVEGTFDDSFKQMGVTIFNPDTTNICFVATGAAPVADNTCQYVPPGATKTFAKGAYDAKISCIMSGGSGATIYITPSSAVEGIG